MSMVGIRPKQFVDQHDYLVMKQSKVQGAYSHDRYIGLYSTIKQQIREKAMLSRQIYEEEQKQFEEQIKQVENQRLHHHLNQLRDQNISNQSNFAIRDGDNPSAYFEIPLKSEIQTPKLDKSSSERQIRREKSQSREMDSLDSKYLERHALREPSEDRHEIQRSGKHDSGEWLKHPKFTGYFQGQVNLNTGKMAGYYYNTNTRATFKNTLSKQAQDDEVRLLNQRIQNHTQGPPLTNHYLTYRDDQSASTPRMAKPYPESREGKSNQSQRPFLTPPTSQIHSQGDPCQIQNENEIMATNNITNPEEDHFNESLLTLLNGQQDLQKQSFNLMQDMTCRHGYDTLMRCIPIYD